MTDSTGSPDHLLLDEMFSADLARSLIDQGIDCRSVAADPALPWLADELIADTALEENRVLVTENVVDFELLRQRRVAEGASMPSLIYIVDDLLPRNRGFKKAVADALATAARVHSASRHGGVYWLE